MAIYRRVRTTVFCDCCGDKIIDHKSDGTGMSRAWAAYHARQQGATTGSKIVCKKCRIRRRIEKCGLQKKWGAAGKDGETCLGFVRENDDEPIEQCKRCIACTCFDWEAERQRLSI